MLAASGVLMASQLGGVAWLLLWPAACALVIAAGYLRLGASILGKRPDGSLPLAMRLFHWPYLMATGLCWRAMRLSPEPCHSEIAPGLFVGRRPTPIDLPEGVAMVVDLTAEFSPAPGVLEGRAYRCIPTLDGTPPDERESRALIAELARFEGPIYIHCAFGHGRSVLITAATMVQRKIAASPDEALAMIKAIRPRIGLSRAQRALLAKLVG